MHAPIVVVTGLPRSGTSLVMQMLRAGGVEPLTDGERSADEDNPRGYFELEAVKRLPAETDWVSAARGRAVKVISHLAGRLPPGERYRVVLVERDLDEVLASQAKMIQRRGQAAPDESLVRKAFLAHLAAFERTVALRPEFALLRVGYADLLRDPLDGAKRIAAFVGEGLPAAPDAAAMAAAIDPTLYRNRRGR